MRSAYDLVVVGGGLSGGLPAATYLQKSGLDVLVLEANSELASFCCSHETWPQTLDSPHVGVELRRQLARDRGPRARGATGSASGRAR